jgi:hypothetical protein
MCAAHNPLFGDEINPLNGLSSAREILSFLEETWNNLAEAYIALDNLGKRSQFTLSQDALAGQMVLFLLLRDTLDQVIDRNAHKK